MRASFFEFNVAISGLFTARGNLEVTSHNIANASIVGYTRQYAEQRASTPLSVYNGKGMIGTGSEVYGVGQIRDSFLDRKFWTERGVLGEYSAKKAQLSITESIFNPLSGTSMNDAFNDFFTKLQTLNENAGNATYRTNLIQSGENLVNYFQLTSQSFKKQQTDINTEIKSMVDIINSLGEQIRSLNRQISTYELDGSKANDLRDQRARLVDELSLYVNVEVSETERNPDYAAGLYSESEDRGRSDKRFSVTINGYNFINHYDLNTLSVEERPVGEKNNPMDVESLYDVQFSNGNAFDMYSSSLKGELKGLIDVRDGNNGYTNGQNTSYKGIPHYMNQLNELVRTFARAINEGTDKDGKPIPGVIGHVDGYGFDGAKYTQGILFFTWDQSITSTANTGWNHYDKLTVDNFKINPDLIKNPERLAAAAGSTGDKSDNDVIKGLLKIKEYSGLFSQGKLIDFITGMTGELGIDLNQATKFTSNYTDVTASINNERLSVSGVDINEEIVNMMKYQQLYQASAKLVSIIDSIYDTTINRLGNW